MAFQALNRRKHNKKGYFGGLTKIKGSTGAAFSELARSSRYLHKSFLAVYGLKRRAMVAFLTILSLITYPLQGSFVLAAPDKILPSIQISDINGQTPPFNFICPTNPLFNPVQITGSGAGEAPPGNISQYGVSVDWGDGGEPEVVSSNFVSTNGGPKGPFTFTFDAGPHEFTIGANNVITVTLFHQNASGNDNTEAASVSVTVCVVPDPPGNITVVKSVVNDDQGTASAGDFIIHLENAAGQDVSTSPNPGSETGTSYDVLAGTYTVREESALGYNVTYGGDCAADGTITVASAETKTCTVTNSDTPLTGTLTVIKQVVNDNGGTLEEADFPLFINSDPTTHGAAVVVDAGTYTVSETNSPGYSANFGGDCDTGGKVTVNSGEDKTCTITNDDQAGTLTVIKEVMNDDGGSSDVQDFALFIDGVPVNSNDATAVDAGNHVVSETNLDGYIGSFGGDCDLNGNVIIGLGESKTCIIVNDDVAGSLTVIKEVINDNGGTFSASAFPLFIDGNSTQNGVASAVSAGQHTVSETNITGYSATFSGDCNESGLVTIELGESKTCTITNDDQPGTLTVFKEVVNDNGGTATASDFALFVNGGAATDGVANVVNAGDHVVSETNLPGYAASFRGDCDQNGNVTVGLGQDKICTIINNDISGSLTVIKEVINDHGGTAGVNDFPLFVNGTPVSEGVATLVQAGTHAVTETNLPGYAASFSGDCDSNGEVAVGLDEHKTCTITNNDIAGTITVIKEVINDNGGTMEVSDFMLMVDESVAIHNEAKEVLAGPHTVSEKGAEGYSASFSGDCDENGLVTVDIGENKICTITNNDLPGSLTVTKLVNLSNGGTAVTEDFLLFVNGESVESGVAKTVNAGSFTITEANLPGYVGAFSGDCDVDGNITVSVGESKECIITNSDTPATLTVIKNVTNNDGGTKAPGDFTITVGGANVSQPTFGGSSDGVVVTLNAGHYSVTEEGLAGYIMNLSEDCTGTIGVGESKTCTITNDDMPASLTVIKLVINDNEGTKNATDFEIEVTHSSTLGVATELFPGSSEGTTIEIPAGNFSVDEIDSTGYIKELGENCTGVLANGDNKTCTIINNDVIPPPPDTGTIVVIKEVVNDNGGTLESESFTMKVDAVNPSLVSFPGSEEGTGVVAEVGDYSITETLVAGYEVTYSSDCTGTLGKDEIRICTVTNNDIAPTLTVIKEVINDNGGTLAAVNFTINVTGDGANPASFPGSGGEGTLVTLNVGEYSVDEETVAGYTKTVGPGCSGTLGLAETKTCTITNNDIPASLTVIKEVKNDHGATKSAGDFTFLVIAGNPSLASFPGSGGEGTTITIDAGEFEVVEQPDPDERYTVEYGEACSGSAVNGASIVCTVLNDDILLPPTTSTLIVKKEVINNHGGSSVPSDFTLAVSALNPTIGEFAGSAAGTVVTIDPGEYSVDEPDVPATYTMSLSADCSGTIAAGETKTCIVTNDDVDRGPGGTGNTTSIPVVAEALLNDDYPELTPEFAKITASTLIGAAESQVFAILVNDLTNGTSFYLSTTGSPLATSTPPAHQTLADWFTNTALTTSTDPGSSGFVAHASGLDEFTTYSFVIEIGDDAPISTETSNEIITGGVLLVITNEDIHSITPTAATVTWDTNRPGTSRVIYDTVSHSELAGAPNYGYAFSTEEDETLVEVHGMAFSGLTPLTTYYFRPISHASPEVLGIEVSFTTTSNEPAPEDPDGGGQHFIVGGGPPGINVPTPPPTSGGNTGTSGGGSGTTGGEVLGEKIVEEPAPVEVLGFKELPATGGDNTLYIMYLVGFMMTATAAATLSYRAGRIVKSVKNKK